MGHSASISVDGPDADDGERTPIHSRADLVRDDILNRLSAAGLQLHGTPEPLWVEAAGQSELLAVEIYLSGEGDAVETVELEATADSEHRDDSQAVAQYRALLAGLVDLARRWQASLWDDETGERINAVEVAETAERL